MPCDLMRLPNETPQMRKDALRETTDKIGKLIAEGKVIAKVKGGMITFVMKDGTQLSEQLRNRMTDNCIYRRVMKTNPAAARAIMRAGRVDPRLVAAGWHSHDGGRTFQQH